MFRPPKVITDPICGVIDISAIQPIIDHPLFQALRYKRQLGMSYLAFPSATHSRFVHSIGAYHATQEFAGRLYIKGVISAEERDAVSVYALCHDIGHLAFSHVTEDFCPQSNGDMSADIMAGPLRSTIESCGANVELVEAIARHRHPLSKIVSDKNLGMEKLDYLERDSYFTTRSRPPGIDILRKYIYYVHGEVVIDESAVDNALEILNFYIKMYKGVYHRKITVIAERMFQKMVHNLILAGELRAEELRALSDTRLEARFIVSKHTLVREFYKLLEERKLFRETVVVRLSSTISETRVVQKPINVHGISEEEMARLTNSPALQKKNHAALAKLEQEIERAVGLPENSVLVVPIFNPERFQPKDVLIYNSNKLDSLKERRPAHFKSMEELARAYSALRICTLEAHREQLSSPTSVGAVLEILRSLNVSPAS